MDDLFIENINHIKAKYDSVCRDVTSISQHIENEGKNFMAHIERINNDVNNHIKRTFIDPFMQ